MMRKTMLIGVVITLTSLVTWANGRERNAVVFSELQEKTPDGRFDTKCTGIVGKLRNVCELSFYRLLAEPERFHGRLVNLKGFLVESDGSLVLFPNQESYENGANIDGVQLQGLGVEKLKLKMKTNHVLKGASATGYFDANFIGSGLWRSGALRDVQYIGAMSRNSINGVPVPPNKP